MHQLVTLNSSISMLFNVALRTNILKTVETVFVPSDSTEARRFPENNYRYIVYAV